MKRVIRSSLYNTETAREVGSIAPNGLESDDFSHFSETLYCTKAGKYFLHGEGHANSRYGVWRGNTGNWGEKIIPYSYAQAEVWVKENLSAEIYASEFGETKNESDYKVPLSLVIPPEIKRMLEKMRATSGDSISKIVEHILIEYFEQ